METVDIRELKTHLSRHLKRVRAGARLLVTERGRSIATISPVDAPADVDWAHQLVAEGSAHWNGGKPAGARRRSKTAGRTSLVDCDRGSPVTLPGGTVRGFDSIHLASYAEVARRAGIDDTRFSSFDDRLNQAARKLTRILERTGQKTG